MVTLSSSLIYLMCFLGFPVCIRLKTPCPCVTLPNLPQICLKEISYLDLCTSVWFCSWANYYLSFSMYYSRFCVFLTLVQASTILSHFNTVVLRVTQVDTCSFHLFIWVFYSNPCEHTFMYLFFREGFRILPIMHNIVCVSSCLEVIVSLLETCTWEDVESIFFH